MESMNHTVTKLDLMGIQNTPPTIREYNVILSTEERFIKIDSKF